MKSVDCKHFGIAKWPTQPSLSKITAGYDALASQGLTPEFSVVTHPDTCDYDNTDSRCIDGPELPRCYDERNTFWYCYPRM